MDEPRRMRFTIRRVDETDLDVIETLEDLHRKTFTDGSLMAKFIGYWWIAQYGETPVGFAGMIPSNQGRQVGYLYRFGVLKPYRGNGLQRRMTRVCERKARSLGWRELVTDTHKNPPSANSLIACGFKTYNPEKPWSFDGAVYWRKSIASGGR